MANVKPLKLDGGDVKQLASGDTVDPAFLLNNGSIGLVIPDLGAVITTGIKAYVEIPYACTITGWTMLGDVSGSLEIDLYYDSYTDYGTNTLMTTNSSFRPKITTAVKGQSTTLTGWTTSLTKGYILGFVVVGTPASIKRALLQLQVTRSS